MRITIHACRAYTYIQRCSFTFHLFIHICHVYIIWSLGPSPPGSAPLPLQPCAWSTLCACWADVKGWEFSGFRVSCCHEAEDVSKKRTHYYYAIPPSSSSKSTGEPWIAPRPRQSRDATSKHRACPSSSLSLLSEIHP